MRPPEHLPPAEHIKQVEKRVKSAAPKLKLEEKDTKGLIGHSEASVELAISRVRIRVSQGGHDVVIRRRFAAGLRNFQTIYKNLVDEWAHLDNSGNSPRLLEEGVKT